MGVHVSLQHRCVRTAVHIDAKNITPVPLTTTLNVEGVEQTLTHRDIKCIGPVFNGLCVCEKKMVCRYGGGRCVRVSHGDTHGLQSFPLSYTL